MTARLDEQGWGRTVRGGHRRRGANRALVVVVSVLVLVALVWGGAAVRASQSMERVEVDTFAGGRPTHILVVGSDSREGLTEEERRELVTGSVAGDRTDTIFVMTFSGGRTGLLAFPRDLWVTRCDGTQGRINTAMQMGGPDCLVETIQNVLGIGVDHFMRVDFLGFRDIVDAVGGVDMCLDKPISDPHSGVNLPAGCQQLDGREALGYVRVRKIDSDFERIKRQQQFLRALAGEMLSPSTVLNVPRLYDTAGKVGGALTVDQRFGVIDLGKLGLAMRGLAGGRSVTETVPTESASIGGAAVLLPVEGAAEELFAGFRDGSVLRRAGQEASEE